MPTNKDLPTRVYAYGLPFGPTQETRDLVQVQLALASRFRASLVKLSRARRDREHALMCAASSKYRNLCEQIDTMSAQIEDLRAVALKQNSKARRILEDSPVAAEIDDLKAHRKALYADRSDLRPALRSKVKAKIDKLWALHYILEKALRNAFAAQGLFWGTYNAVVKAIQMAERTASGPQYRGWDQLAVQIQSTDPYRGFAEDTRVQVVTKDLARKHYALKIRVGSTKDSKPVFAEFPMKMHRPLPKDAVLKMVKVQRIEGPRPTWKALFVISSALFVEGADLTKRRGHGVISVSLGFRGAQDNYLVGQALGYDAERRTLVLPESTRYRMQLSEDIGSIRKKEFNKTRTALADWLLVSEVPVWLEEITETLFAWKSEARLARLVLRLRDNRFKGDSFIMGSKDAEKRFAMIRELREWIDPDNKEAKRKWEDKRVEAKALRVLGILEFWRIRDLHLWQYGAGAQRHAVATRNEAYRCWARDLANRYDTCLITETDWRKIAKATPVEVTDEYKHVKRWRHKAAPGTLEEALRGAFGSGFVDVKSKEVCPLCKKKPRFSDQHVTRCHCGFALDRGLTKCWNMLDAHGVDSSRFKNKVYLPNKAMLEGDDDHAE